MATKTIAIANEKGGVGKTVTVINLAAGLSLLNKKVLVVDMDPQANATKGLGFDTMDDTLSVYDLMTHPQDHVPLDVITPTGWEGLDLLPSHVDLSGAEIELVDAPGRENRLKESLVQLDGSYDFILLDSPPSLSLLTVNVFAYAQQVLIPCQTHPYAYGALEELCDTIDAVRKEINPHIQILGIVPTFFDARTRVSQKVLSQLHSDTRYKDMVFDTVVRTNTTIAESAAEGKPVLFYRRSSYGAIDYSDLAEELVAKC